MRWNRGAGGGDVEDRRGMSGGAVAGGGLGIVGLLLALFLGFDPFGGSGGGGGIGVDPRLDPLPRLPQGQPSRQAPARDDLAAFVAFVVDDVQDSWEQAFAEAGEAYQRTQLVLFDDAVRSACGTASSATGPFYCPVDQKVYLDLGFFRELRQRFGAPGDFAQAYVIAHEFGHHVQHVLGIDRQVRRAQQENPDRANELSVRLELQADCLAGVWGSTTAERGLLEPGDLEEGLRAAASIGDDRIQRRSGGQVDPESFTHGSSRQRVRWFTRGFETGDPEACDTFAG